MAQQVDDLDPSVEVWCGRSWDALTDRRGELFAHAQALKDATHVDAGRVVADFLDFYGDTGAALLKDEEEWIFRSFRPIPGPIAAAFDEHDVIRVLAAALVSSADTGVVHLSEVHRLGSALEDHLVMEEEHVRPLVASRRLSIPAR